MELVAGVDGGAEDAGEVEAFVAVVFFYGGADAGDVFCGGVGADELFVVGGDFGDGGGVGAFEEGWREFVEGAGLDVEVDVDAFCGAVIVG